MSLPRLQGCGIGYCKGALLPGSLSSAEPVTNEPTVTWPAMRWDTLAKA